MKQLGAALSGAALVIIGGGVVGAIALASATSSVHVPHPAPAAVVHTTDAPAPVVNLVPSASPEPRKAKPHHRVIHRKRETPVQQPQDQQPAQNAPAQQQAPQNDPAPVDPPVDPPQPPVVNPPPPGPGVGGSAYTDSAQENNAG